MITRTVRLQLAAFALLSVALVAILSANYVGLTDKIAGGSYVVSADLAQSGGIFVGAEVTYRGVTVGKVEGLRLSGDGVVVDARLDRGTEVPKDTEAVVENRSAVGEQYLDLQPRTVARRRTSPSGDVIPRDRTAFPLRIDQLLQHVDNTVASVPRDALVTTVDELAKAFKGGGSDLQRLIDSGNALTDRRVRGAARRRRASSTTVASSSTRRSGAATTSARASPASPTSPTPCARPTPTCGSSSTAGPWPSSSSTRLIAENKQSLAALLANFITIGNVTTARLDGIEQLLVTYPDVVTGGFTVAARRRHGALRARAQRRRPQGLRGRLRGHDEGRPAPDHGPAAGQPRRPLRRVRAARGSTSVERRTRPNPPGAGRAGRATPWRSGRHRSPSATGP